MKQQLRAILMTTLTLAAPVAWGQELSPSPSPIATTQKIELPANEVKAVASPAPTPQPEMMTMVDADALKVEAFLDVYYMYDFNEPFPPGVPSSATVSSATMPLGNTTLRSYDGFHNQLSLNLAELTFKKHHKSVDFLMDLDFGQQADYNARSDNSVQRIEDESSKHIGQALITWRPSGLSNLSVTAGKMTTHMGLESAKAKDNWQYSRTMMFSFGMPIWHTGVRADYTFSDQWGMLLAVYNGWNGFYDNNSAKTLGLGFAYHLANLNVHYNYIAGAEQDNEGVNPRQVHELNSTWILSPSFSLSFESLIGSEANRVVAGSVKGLTTWSGASLQANWKTGAVTDFSPRVEYYNDPDGATLGNGDQKVWSGTLTEAIDLGDGLETRFEGRMDKTSADGTFARRGAGVLDQYTFTIALLYVPGML